MNSNEINGRKKKKHSKLILVFALLVLGSTVAFFVFSYDKPEPELIPREVLFGNPDKITARLSPDGGQISYLAPVNGVLNVWVGPADNPDAAEPVTNDTDRGIRIYFWAYTNEHILYLQDQAGDENWRVYCVNLATGETTDLTPLDGVQARIQAVSQKFPDEIMIALNDRNPQLHDIYRINITTGEKSSVMENDGFLGFVTDDNYNIRFAMRMTPDGGNEILKATEERGWEPFMEIAMVDLLTTGPAGFDKTGTILYMIDSRERNTAALFALDLEIGEQTLIAEDPHADVSDFMIHPTEKNIQAVAFTYERKHWQVIDESMRDDLEYLNTVVDGDVEVVSRTLDDKYWIVAYLMDDGPVQYYRYDREAREAQFLFTNREALDGLSLAKMHYDLIYAVEWAIQKGIADHDQVATMGGSYGGYATLVGMTFTPETFACGVDIVGPSNLTTLLETIPPYWQPQVELFATRVGDHRTEEGRALLIERSPLTYVDQVQKPLLIGQGANDPRVKQAESDQIVQAMQEKNIPVTYLLYTDEGHGFARPENRLSFYAVTEAFLTECLSGRYEPIGDDFEGSSITVPIGAEEVPGLAEALSE
jgi:dipeptidyl aminopeptidase/acylaminoacyl peptidase